MTILQGDCGGITLRYSEVDHSGYRFQVCANGTVLLKAYSDGATYKTLFSSSSSTIHQGFNQSNTLAVVAQNNHIGLYVNKQKIRDITDDTRSKGQFALFALDRNEPTEVAFSNLNIWQL